MEEEEEGLDPRVQNELEKLNRASLLINKLENELDGARSVFKVLLTTSLSQLDALTTKLGSKCIERARGYYDARLRSKEVQKDTYKVAVNFEKAIETQNVAREMVELAEQGYEKRRQKQPFDLSWQEMLNHSTSKVLEAEEERRLCEFEHQKITRKCSDAEDDVNKQLRENKRSVMRSKPYYELKAELNTKLDRQKEVIQSVQGDIDSAKRLYSKTLKNLETISEEIHARRRQNATERNSLGERESGVGSETPEPPLVRDTQTPTPKNPDTEIPDGERDEDSHNETLKPDKPTGNGSDNPTENGSDKSAPTSGNSQTINLNNNELESACPIISVTADTPDDNQIDVVSADILMPMQSVVRSPSGTSVNSIGSSIEVSPVVRRHRRNMSGTIHLSARKLLESEYDSDSSLGSNFTVMADKDVRQAMRQHYFDGTYTTSSTDDESSDDYYVLPHNLAAFQSSYEDTRKSMTDEAHLKLDQILQLLDKTDNESVV